MAKALLALTLFHLVFFRHFYFQNPFAFATSTALDMQFAASRFLGEELRAGRADPVDPYHYPSQSSIPFLSTWYPLHRLQAWVGSFLSVDAAWVVFFATGLLHYLWGSVGAYLLFRPFGELIALFGALTLTYHAYAIKQNSEIQYTVGWITWVFYAADIHCGWLLGVSLGMMTLAGYWALAIYVWPLSFLYWLSRSVS